MLVYNGIIYLNNKQPGETAMPKFTAQQRIDNEKKNWIDRSKALYLAQERMKREGHTYPTPTGKSVLELHDEVLAYNQLESSYMLEFLRQPSGPRPVESYPAREKCFNAKPEDLNTKPAGYKTSPTQEWQNKYDG